MKHKTYMARDLKEALAQVKKELGPGAVILSTQACRFPNNGTGEEGRSGVQITAAADHSTVFDPEMFSSRAWQSHPNGAPPFHQIQEDLEELKGLLRQWLHHNGPPSWLLHHKEVAVLYRILLKAGLDKGLLLKWLEHVQELLARGKSQPRALKKEAFQYLMNTVKVIDPWPADTVRPRLWTFIGPTGVGKTTTIAKLAAQFALVRKVRVGLITLDNQRLGAHDQLAAYGRITGLPLLVAERRADLVEALQNLRDLDLVLIDTPGRSPHAAELPKELGKLLGGLADLKHHLVLSATQQEGNLAAAIKGFGALPLTSLVIAKLDESMNFSGVFNQVCHHQIPISYLTTGQQVPGDIELATQQKVTDLLLQRYHLNAEGKGNGV